MSAPFKPGPNSKAGDLVPEYAANHPNPEVRKFYRTQNPPAMSASILAAQQANMHHNLARGVQGLPSTHLHPSSFQSVRVDNTVPFKLLRPSVTAQLAHGQASGRPANVDFRDERNYLAVSLEEEQARFQQEAQRGVVHACDYPRMRTYSTKLQQPGQQMIPIHTASLAPTSVSNHAATVHYDSRRALPPSSSSPSKTFATRQALASPSKQPQNAPTNDEAPSPHVRYQILIPFGSMPPKQLGPCDERNCLEHAIGFLAVNDPVRCAYAESQIGHAIQPLPDQIWKLLAHLPQKRRNEIVFRQLPPAQNHPAKPAFGVSVAGLMWRNVRLQQENDAVFGGVGALENRTISVSLRHTELKESHPFSIRIICTHGTLSRIGLAYEIATAIYYRSRGLPKAMQDMRTLRLVSVYRLDKEDHWHVACAYPESP